MSNVNLFHTKIVQINPQQLFINDKNLFYFPSKVQCYLNTRKLEILGKIYFQYQTNRLKVILPTFNIISKNENVFIRSMSVK